MVDVNDGGEDAELDAIESEMAVIEAAQAVAQRPGSTSVSPCTDGPGGADSAETATVQCIIPDAGGDTDDGGTAVLVEQLIHLLASGELRPSFRVFVPPEQTAADAVPLRALVDMAAVRRLREKLKAGRRLDAAITGETGAAEIAGRELERMQGKVLQTQREVDDWELAGERAKMAVSAGIKVLEVGAMGKAVADRVERSKRDVSPSQLLGDILPAEEPAEWAGGDGAKESTWTEIRRLDCDMSAATAAGAPGTPRARGTMRRVL
jgi:hypothetical protein